MRIISFMTIALCLALAPAQAAPMLGSNIIVNGDAESGLGSLSGNDILAAPGWSTSNNFTVVQYNPSTGFPGPSSPGPANRGSNFFAGGPNTAASSAVQLVDVSTFAVLIDLGQVLFDLSGYLGGFTSHTDNALLRAEFLNASSAILGSASIGPVTASDRNDVTGLLFRSTSGSLPSGTRVIGLHLDATRLVGAYADGYADNLSLILSGPQATVPEPKVALFLAIGLAAVISRLFVRP